MITSIHNDKVKNWRKLHKRKGRTEAKAFLIEGIHLVEEAWKSGATIQQIIYEENFRLPGWCEKYQTEMVSTQVFKQISQTMSPQGIVAIISKKEPEQLTGEQIILIDAVQDPGNLGTIIRTADAAGMDAIVLGVGTVDLYNDKVIRATQGSLFHIPIYEADLMETIEELQAKGYEIWVTALEDAKNYTEIAVPSKVAILLGNEGAGVNESLMNVADQRVTIPIYGKAESLNVSVAAGILMYHLKK